MVAELGSRAVTAQADVRDHGQLAAAVNEAAGTLGRLDIVVAAAAIRGSAPAHELAEEGWQDLIDVNLTGAWLTCKVAVPHVIAGGRGGSVVLASSAAGVKPYPAMAHYVAAKHGVTGLARALATELAADRIRVNSVHPTQVDTDMIQNDIMYRLFRPDLEHPTRRDFAAASRATGLLPVDWVESADVSSAVAFLASDDARYITGTALPVDAGALIT
jgi:NAD(P)-dependent dehydrogenase (short-subunit alcohol dehydrogenase family)